MIPAARMATSSRPRVSVVAGRTGSRYWDERVGPSATGAAAT